jgi:hypothetical protein
VLTAPTAGLLLPPLLVGALLLAGCGGHTAAASSPAGTSGSPTPTPAATAEPLTSPLTGERIAALKPVVAIKVDNVGTYGENGLDAADVVYCEEVEGGLTRLLAIFASQQPTSVGPVRSARESDLELLGEYGPIALGFSGANSGVLAEVDAADVRNVDYDNLPALYSMDYSRPRPYQFIANVAELAAKAPGALEKPVGFTFGAAPTAGSAGSAFSVTYPGALISGAFSGAAGYTISRNGSVLETDDRPVTTTDVLLQYVTVTSSRFTDHDHNVTPFSVTVGTGRAVLLRGGQSYPGTWSRATKTAATTWTSSGGGPLRLAPGRTWVVLVPVAVGATVS